MSGSYKAQSSEIDTSREINWGLCPHAEKYMAASGVSEYHCLALSQIYQHTTEEQGKI